MTDYKELVEALKPFARIAEMSPDILSGHSVHVNIDRCRQAKAAIEALSLAAQPDNAVSTAVEQPVAVKTHGAWDGLECLEELPNDTYLYAFPVSADTIRQQALEEAATRVEDLEYFESKYDIAAAIRSLASSPASASATPDPVAPATPARDAKCEALLLEIARLRELVRRYRNETPLGHQPHMIAAEADAALRIDKEQQP